MHSRFLKNVSCPSFSIQKEQHPCVSGTGPGEGAWADPFHPLWHFPGKEAALFQRCSLSDYTEPLGKLKQAPRGSKMHPSECELGCGERFWSLLGRRSGESRNDVFSSISQKGRPQEQKPFSLASERRGSAAVSPNGRGLVLVEASSKPLSPTFCASSSSW